MPAATYPHRGRPLSPSKSVAATTPSRAKHVYPISPSSTNGTSYPPTITPGSQQPRLNIVTRVAVEGKAKQERGGAAIKMYLKISLPLDNLQPGSMIPLFPEENVKILTSQVHPLDNRSVPYNFSSAASPLLHNAARSLNLPARSPETFQSAFSLPSTASTSFVSTNGSSKSTISSSSSGGDTTAPVDIQYTGQILVSGYHISYVTPNVFPVRSKSVSETEMEDSRKTPYKSRRMSIGERNTAQFMAAIDMWIPFISHPPRSPYLLSIPVPRCLHNNIKLRIFPPTTASASYASLSSIEEDGAAWDLTSDPHVTRTVSSRPSRSNSYSHFADDESSDSSTTGFSDGCGIQGTFPSAERIRVRWAKPLKNIDVPGGTGDGRRRVGVKDVKGEMTCLIRGKSKAKHRDGIEGVLMDVEYKGVCKGLWFPGVATLLGMDVGLETKGSDVYWLDGSMTEWSVDGGSGYTGFDIGTSPRQLGIQSEDDSGTPHSRSSPLPEDKPPGSRTNSSSSTSSLLRAPLPSHNIGEYSFEGQSTATLASPESIHLGTMSTIPSLQNSQITSPGIPITLHINMNELIHPAKNSFTFSIAGTILVVARSTMSRSNTQLSNANHSIYENAGSDPDPIVIPRFTVLAADSESVSTIVRNEITSPPAVLEIYNSTGDIRKDPQARRTVLQKGGSTKFSEEGNRIAVRTIGTSDGDMLGNARSTHPPSRPRTPINNGAGLPRVSSNSSLGKMLYPSRPRRDGPLMIPSVVASVTPLIHEKSNSLPSTYAVRIFLNAPADTNSEWLEFGLARPDSNSLKPGSEGEGGRTQNVAIVSATVEDVPVKHEIIAASKPDLDNPSFGLMSGKNWVSWVKVHVGPVGGGAVVIDYIVDDLPGSEWKGKAKESDGVLFNVLLPAFSIPVGRLEVHIDTSGVVAGPLRSNCIYQQSNSSGGKILNFSMEPFYHPSVSLRVYPMGRKQMRLSKASWLVLLTLVLAVFGLLAMQRLRYEIQRIDDITNHQSDLLTTSWNDVSEPVTITTTVYTIPGTKRWFTDEPTSSSPTPTTVAATNLVPDATGKHGGTAFRPSGTLPSPVPENTLFVTGTSAAERYALLPIRHVLAISWPAYDFRPSMEKIMQSLDKIWHIFRRVYHYPLDPP